MRNSGPPKLLFLVIAIVLFGVTGFLALKTHRFIVRADHARGRVIALVPETSRKDGNVVYKPVVEFNTPDGTRIEFQSSVGSRPPAFEQNEMVGVLYEKADPHAAEINSFWSLWLAPLISGGIFLVFAALTCSMYVRIRFPWSGSRRKKRTKPSPAKEHSPDP